MKKINLYIAMLAVAMSSCSQDDLDVKANDEKCTLRAEICSNESRMAILDKDRTGKSPLIWQESDAFMAFKSPSEISTTNVCFFATYLPENDSQKYECEFYSSSPFKSENVVYAVYPDNMVDIKSTTETLKVQVPSEIRMDKTHNTILLGKNVKKDNSDFVKFYQTMGLLELHFTSIEGFDALQIAANRPIASKEKDGYHATLSIPANLADATVTLPADASKTILLTKGGMGAGGSKVYCPLPVADDYTQITISFVRKVGSKYEVSDSPWKTIQAKNGHFAVGKKIYAIDCSYSGTTFVGAGLPSWGERYL